MKNKGLKIAAAVIIFAGVTLAAFFAADALQENEAMRSYVRSSGIFGAILIGLIGGLNAFVPIPPATFAPLFLEAGLSPLLIVLGFTIGTTIADSLGYLLGWFGRGYVNDNHPKITRKLQTLFEKHERLVPFAVFAYFALAPLPNEIILIPLALIGYKYKSLLIPLILGNIIHHSIMVFGYSKIFSWIF